MMQISIKFYSIETDVANVLSIVLIKLIRCTNPVMQHFLSFSLDFYVDCDCTEIGSIEYCEHFVQTKNAFAVN